MLWCNTKMNNRENIAISYQCRKSNTCRGRKERAGVVKWISALQSYGVPGWILVLFSIKPLLCSCWQCHFLEPLHCYWKIKTQQRIHKPTVTLFILKIWETLFMTEVWFSANSTGTHAKGHLPGLLLPVPLSPRPATADTYFHRRLQL